MSENRSRITANFFELCNQIKSGKFLLSSGRINNILRYIASTPELKILMTECNINFCYPYEMNECISTLGSIKIFKLPADQKRVFAIVSGMLFEFDRRDRDFHSFIDTYFMGETPNDSFINFCEAVLQPYAEATEELLKGELTKTITEDEAGEEENRRTMTDAMAEQIVPLVSSIADEVVASNLNQTKQQECLDVLGGMFYAITNSDDKMLKAMWIGVKNTVNVAKNVTAFLESIEDLLKFYAII